ncbi:hypothetical protein K431DRAFT_309104 [Polychaeton citri CBS 116435]|uniref:Indoleamine 2,3-dioxygenase n=1 Tax=Polychaeton citri CBS 116435 TaxID=1314669 RepID=A0A9P4QFU4_9PEZI|nr:hypothetical protein K431DRAFT_309104 [Polychaeton citri CBS 116435]
MNLDHVAAALYSDSATLPKSTDPFTITINNGFMPLHTPLTDLPSTFKPLMDLLNDMPVTKQDGSAGLLADYKLGHVVDVERVLPDLTSEIDALREHDGKPDLSAVTAAFRDYSFLASAYLLEPCWEKWNKDRDGYGLGRQILPRAIAGPLVKCGDLLNIPPFMSYAAAYSLYNYRFEDRSIGTQQYSNLRLIRAFEHGLDPSSSEAGFILTHVDMVKNSPNLIKGAADILTTLSATPNPRHVDRDIINESFNSLLTTMTQIEASMENMWTQSRPKDYISYRTFIFGITNQSMFPDGVVYEGINNDEPLSFRGESGANDSMIPLLDALLQIPMPDNPLTKHLVEFRSYRPKPHREFLAWVREMADAAGVRNFCEGDPETAVLYLRLLNNVRSFRWRHWLFAREYIIRRSSHPTATGGSPIVTWLPNQLFAVMDLMMVVWSGVDEGYKKNEAQPFVKEMMGQVEEQRVKLGREVERWCQERGV